MSRTRRLIAGSALVVATAGSWALASQARSPQALAARAEPPPPSVITVPVRWRGSVPIVPESALRDRWLVRVHRAGHSEDVQIKVVKEKQGWLSISAPPGSIRPGDRIRVWPPPQ